MPPTRQRETRTPRTKTPAPGSGQRLIVVSNRLPVALAKAENGRWRAEPGQGGLVSAMLPVLRDRGGLWIGWTGTTGGPRKSFDKLLHKASTAAGYELVPIALNQHEYDNYYCGFSNEIVWPLFHDLAGQANFDPAYWPVYQQVNRRFADAIVANARPGDFIWVHDYQLMLVAAYLKARGLPARISFFLHIPFPSPDIYLRMPRRFELIEGLLQYDLIGFQTLRDRNNFLQCVRLLIGPAEVTGSGPVVDIRVRPRAAAPSPFTDPALAGRQGDYQCRIGAFPISIDNASYQRLAGDDSVSHNAAWLRANLRGRRMMLSVSRLDYTKGIPQMLLAYRDALRRFPELRRNITLVQVVVPSRRNLASYDGLRVQIEQLVGQINGELTEAGWVPIHHLYRSLSTAELVAYYVAADIALIGPLKDGMNLVAKEYCAAQTGEDGTLILSEFAGAAGELHQGALMINPHDVEGVANTIHHAYRMQATERRRRIRRLRRIIRDKDIFRWVDSFLDAAIAADLDAFPRLVDYLPQRDDSLLLGDVPVPPL